MAVWDTPCHGGVGHPHAMAVWDTPCHGGVGHPMPWRCGTPHAMAVWDTPCVHARSDYMRFKPFSVSLRENKHAKGTHLNYVHVAEALEYHTNLTKVIRLTNAEFGGIRRLGLIPSLLVTGLRFPRLL